VVETVVVLPPGVVMVETMVGGVLAGVSMV
jgi:hypothetical protein